MKFLADMGIAQATINWLRENGYDSVHLREKGLQNISDTEIVKPQKKRGELSLLVIWILVI